jgi:uncharacterized OB-fold protein
MENVKLKGTGSIVSYTIIHEASESFKDQVPYVMAIIELDEGTRLTGQIVNANCKENDIERPSNNDEANRSVSTRLKEIEIGSRVKSVFRRISEDGKSGIIHYGYKFKLID